jgi:hypothetical protein
MTNGSADSTGDTFAGGGAGDLTPFDSKKGGTYSSGAAEAYLSAVCEARARDAAREFAALRIRRDRRSIRQAWWMMARHLFYYVLILFGGGAVIGAFWAMLQQ